MAEEVGPSSSSVQPFCSGLDRERVLQQTPRHLI